MADVTLQATITHAYSATGANDPTAEVQLSHWNQSHSALVVLAASALIGAFSNGNGISFGTSGAGGATAITGSYTVPNVPAQSNQTLGGYAVGNTTGDSSSSTFDARTLSLRASDNVSIGWSNGSLVFKAGGGGANFSAGVSGGNTAGDTGITGTRVVFAGGNNITVSQATDANGASITISGPNTAAQSNQTLEIYAVGNTTGQSSRSTYDARTLSFHATGLSVGWSNGSLRFSATHPVVSNAIQSVGSATGSGTNTSRFAADDHVHAGVFSMGVSNVGNSAGDTRVDVGRFVLAGGNNITLSQGTAANGLNTITISAAAQSAQTVGLYGVGNTTQNSSTTLDARTISFGGRGAAIVGFSNGTMQVSVGNGTTFNGANISGSMTYDSAGLQLSMSVAAPGAAAEANHHHLLGANTAGNTTASGSTIGLSGINLTLSGTNNSVINISAPATSSLSATGQVSISTNGSTISIGVPAKESVSYAEIMDGARLTTCAVWNNATYSRRPIFVPFELGNPISAVNTIRILASRSSGTVLHATFFVGIYTIANATSINLLSSTSFNVSLSTSAQYSGVRMYDFTGLGGLSLSEGNYVFGLLASIAASNSLPMQLMGGDVVTLAGAVFSGTDQTSATASSRHILPFWGVWNATSGGLPSAVAASSISGGDGANSPDIYAVIKAI